MPSPLLPKMQHLAATKEALAAFMKQNPNPHLGYGNDTLGFVPVKMQPTWEGFVDTGMKGVGVNNSPECI